MEKEPRKTRSRRVKGGRNQYTGWIIPPDILEEIEQKLFTEEYTEDEFRLMWE